MFSDEEIPGVVAQIARGFLDISYNKRSAPIVRSRMNEILELLGNRKDYLKTKSTSSKIHGMISGFMDIIKNDEWKIRNTDLALNAAKWIAKYCNSGDPGALMQFTRLKCMTHKGQPIYSMEDIK